MDKTKTSKDFKNIILVILGTAILAFGTGVFIVPFDLVTGGVSSFAIILNAIYSFEGSIDIYITIVTWLLFILGFFILGKNFAMKTLISSIVYPIIFTLSYKLITDNVLDGFFNLTSYSDYEGVSIILASVFGGAFVGVGCALAFMGGGSTGGVDVLAFVICKYFRKAKNSFVMFAIDFITIVLGVFLLKDFVLSLLGVLSAFICALVIDRLFMGESIAFIANIVSDKYEEINNAVIEKLDRTTTLISSIGGYSKKNKKMIMVSFTMRQYSELMGLVSMIDKDAFMTIHRAHEINGEGWTR